MSNMSFSPLILSDTPNYAIENNLVVAPPCVRQSLGVGGEWLDQALAWESCIQASRKATPDTVEGFVSDGNATYLSLLKTLLL